MSVGSILRIASRIEASDPLLAHDLEMSAIALSAVMNPDRKNFDGRVDEVVSILKSIREELKTALEDFDTAEELSQWFNDGFDEEEELQKALKKPARAASVAGIWDTVKDKAKNFFKKDEPESEQDSGMSPSYRMDDKTTDEFVEGKKDWADPSHYVEKDSKENDEFFDGANDLLERFDDVKNRPSRGYVEWILEEIERILKIGEKILGGGPKPKPEPKEKPQASKPPSSSAPHDLESTVDHYVDMLKQHSGDSKKTIQLLKELFGKVGPALEPERASISSRHAFSALVRVARERKDLRPILLPRLARLANR